MTARSLSVQDLAAWCASWKPVSSFEEMPGGASLRRFFRVQFLDGTRAIAMFFPDAQTTGAARLPKLPLRWPFLEIQETLVARGIRVPEVFAAHCDAGWLLVEDLGPNCLADYLQRHPESRDQAYSMAVRDIAQAQHALQVLPPGSVIGQRCFDFDFLREELEHFVEYGLVARGFSLSPSQRARWDELSEKLCERITELPYSFSHRDYQSRNLMVNDPLSLTWIDFQDAALGPRVYDLVALLRDSYQSFDEAFIDSRLREYVSACGMEAAAFETIRREFDLVTVQRKLKDAGRFVFIDRHKSDPSYLEYVEPTLAMVMRTLKSRPEDELALALYTLLGELGVG